MIEITILQEEKYTIFKFNHACDAFQFAETALETGEAGTRINIIKTENEED